MGLSFVGLLGQTGLCVHGCHQVSSRFIIPQVARTNLAFIGKVTSMYFNDSGQSPESLDDLVAAGYLPPHQLRAPFDNAPGYSATPPYYKSYDFQPGPRIVPKEPTIVVAYERDGLTPIDFRLIERLGHCVLFGDGHVDCLNSTELNDALAGDRQRRIELGWTPPAER